MVFSTPDLASTIAIPLPKTSKEVLEGLSRIWKKNKERLRDFDESTIKTPTPSRIRETQEKKSEKPLTSREAARICGKSKMTIIRAAEKGLIRGTRTEGGHWRFEWPEVTRYQELAGKVAGFKKKDTQWLTPIECARIWGVSVNTARNWIDQGMVYSEKTLGGHRRVPKRFITQPHLPQ